MANASSYERRMSNPPKMRSCVLRCCGWQTKAFDWRVLLISAVLGSESAGMSTDGCESATSAAASSALACAQSGAARCARSRSTLAATRANVSRSSSVRSSSPSIGALFSVTGSRATKVNSASSQGSRPPRTPSEKACSRMTMLERPTHATQPERRMSDSVSQMCTSEMRSTEAVTSIRCFGARGTQCLKAIVPASASRSSSTRPMRILP